MIARNSFAAYHPKKKIQERGNLIEFKLQALMNHKFAFEGYGKVRDMFIFSCFTGIVHVNVMGLTWEMIQHSFDGDLWIVKNQQKTDMPFKIKLCGIMKCIIARRFGRKPSDDRPSAPPRRPFHKGCRAVPDEYDRRFVRRGNTRVRQHYTRLCRNNNLPQTTDSVVYQKLRPL